jgi:phage/conjugal plasmid C-4 type zinc finger TraR family protein
MDMTDSAQELEQAVRNDAILRLRNCFPEPERPSSKFCSCCGEEIPEKRRLAVPGCQFCVECQREFEA